MDWHPIQGEHSCLMPSINRTVSWSTRTRTRIKQLLKKNEWLSSSSYWLQHTLVECMWLIPECVHKICRICQTTNKTPGWILYACFNKAWMNCNRCAAEWNAFFIIFDKSEAKFVTMINIKSFVGCSCKVFLDWKVANSLRRVFTRPVAPVPAHCIICCCCFFCFLHTSLISAN